MMLLKSSQAISSSSRLNLGIFFNNSPSILEQSIRPVRYQFGTESYAIQQNNLKAEQD